MVTVGTAGGRRGLVVVTRGGRWEGVGLPSREDGTEVSVGGGGRVVVNVVIGVLTVVGSKPLSFRLSAMAMRMRDIRKAAASGTRSI